MDLCEKVLGAGQERRNRGWALAVPVYQTRRPPSAGSVCRGKPTRWAQAPLHSGGRSTSLYQQIGRVLSKWGDIRYNCQN